MSFRRISDLLRRAARQDDGLGMPEVLVALMVFAVIATTAGYGMLNAFALTQSSRGRETALSIASSDLDQMRLTATSDNDGLLSVVSAPSAVVQTLGGVTYTVARKVTWQTTNGAVGACGTGSGTLQYKNVTDTVSWRGTNGVTQTVSMSTSIAPLSNLNSDTTGTIIVSVSGVTPTSGVTISITPVSGTGSSSLPNPPQVTDVDGCSFGLLADPGSYTVTASAAGDVDGGGNPTASATVVVVAGQNSLQSFTYGAATTFPLTYPAGAIVPTNLPITLLNSSAGPTTYAATSAVGTPSVRAIPWGDGYTIIAGTYLNPQGGGPAGCVDSSPAAWTTPRPSDGAIGTASPSVYGAAGASAPSTVVPMGTFTLNNLSGLRGKYITAVTATPTGAGDPGCSATQTLKFPVVPSNATSLTYALPYGTWRFYAGTSAGSATTALPSSGSGTIGALTGGVINSLSGGANSVTLDPRAVAGP